MIYLKSNPVGIDLKIQQVQKYLYEKLVNEYDCEVSAYGRAYIDSYEGRIKPKAYIGDGEYKILLIDDRIKGLHFFFIEGDKSDVISHSTLSKYDVDLIVFVNDITKVKGSITHYADEEIKEDIKKHILHFFEIQSVIKGEKALDGFDIDGLKFIHPFFVFKIQATINNF